jgi:hypothetical protein
MMRWSHEEGLYKDLMERKKKYSMVEYVDDVVAYDSHPCEGK